ncbi:MAG: tetratricopeptide repeat protein [Gemmataceae bacterium]
MPFTINGVGTHYYGQTNQFQCRDRCEHCGNVGLLRSYDTTLYFVVVFVPIVPLGTKRILEQCPGCQVHRVLPKKKWEAAKNGAMTSALQKLQDEPNNPEHLTQALLSTSQFQDEELYDRVAALARTDTENAELQFILGQVAAYFRRREEAAIAFEHSFRVNPTPAVQRAAGLNALSTGDTLRAEQYFQFIIRDSSEGDVACWNALIEVVQSEGDHERALRLMDQRDEALPDLADDKYHLHLRKQSEKNRASGKKLLKPTIVDRGGATGGSTGTSRIARFFFPLAVVLGFLGYVGYAYWLESNFPIYIVNGTPGTYTATVNNTPVTLPPYSAVRHRTALGTVRVQAPGTEPIEANVTSDFWGRPFDHTIQVFNPDSIAVIEEETTQYSSTQPPTRRRS